ncbi:Magnesium chelatase, partial [Cymbomonas tetramitiformis]
MYALPLRLQSALPLPSNRLRSKSPRALTQQLRTAISLRRERKRTCTGSPIIRLSDGVPCKRRSLKILAALANEELETDAEKFVKNLVDEPLEEQRKQVSSEIGELEAQRHELQEEIDALYKATFGKVVLCPEADLASNFDRFTGEQEAATGGDEEASGAPSFPEMTEAQFSALGRDSPTQMRQLLQKVQQDSPSWTQFQSTAQTLQLRKTRVAEALERKHRELNDVVGKAKLAAEVEVEDDQEPPAFELPASGMARIVLISGFESFNVSLYRKAAEELAVQYPGLQLTVFSDRDIATSRPAVEAALDNADVFFGSLLFDYDQVEWLREKVERIPTRLVFESALELMGTTQVGTFKMEPSGKSKGPPPVVKAILNKFGSGREEDKMVGYLSFLKIGPKLLKWLPGKKVRDLRNWLTVY